MRRVGAGLLAALAVAAIVVTGLAALGSARGAEADATPPVRSHHAVRSVTGPTIERWSGQVCPVGAVGCTARPPCVEFIAGHASTTRPLLIPRHFRARCASVGDRAVVSGAIPVATRAR